MPIVKVINLIVILKLPNLKDSCKITSELQLHQARLICQLTILSLFANLAHICLILCKFFVCGNV